MKTTRAAKQMVECPKCDGRGTMHEFAHIESGKCFRCGGAGKVAYRATKVVLAEAPALPVESKMLDRMVREIATIRENSNGRLSMSSDYTAFRVNAIRDMLARAGELRAEYVTKFQAAMGRDFALLEAA